MESLVVLVAEMTEEESESDYFYCRPGVHCTTVLETFMKEGVMKVFGWKLCQGDD